MTLLSAIFAVVTFASVIFAVVIASSAILVVVTAAALILDDYEKRQKKETKELKAKEKTDRKFTPQDYRKGGMTISVVDNRKKK